MQYAYTDHIYYFTVTNSTQGDRDWTCYNKHKNSHKVDIMTLARRQNKSAAIFMSILINVNSKRKDIVEPQANMYFSPFQTFAVLWMLYAFLLGNSLASEFYMQTFRNILSVPLFLLWRWNSVPKRRHIKFRSRGITQKKVYNKYVFSSPID